MTTTDDKECLDCMQTKLHCFVCTKCLDQLRRDAVEKYKIENADNKVIEECNLVINAKQEAKKELLDEIEARINGYGQITKSDLKTVGWKVFRAKTLGEQVKKE